MLKDLLWNKYKPANNLDFTVNEEQFTIFPCILAHSSITFT